MASRSVLLSLVVICGCSSDPEASYEEADWQFEADRLLEVDIVLDEADWDQLRFQTRNILDIFGDECGSAPTTSPFTYVPATVTVDGIEVAEVGVRKKGFLGSLDDERPSLKIKFNEYVVGQRLTGNKRLTLNNSKQDPSLMNQCLGYELFNQAGVPAPRCNFARVTVNGRDMGVYVNVESVKKPFLGLHFDDNEGNLYEGTLSDFRSGWTSTFERKTNELDTSRADLQSIVDTLALDDAAMAAELENLIDLDAFFSFWAVESMTSHWDGYSGNNNNFFIYNDPSTGKLTFMPWGADQLFGNGGETQDPAATASTLPNRLYLHGPTRARYLARYAEILDQIWDDDALLARIDQIDALVGSSISAGQAEAYSGAVATLRSTLTGREAILRDGLDAAGPDDAEGLSAPLCFSDVGPATSTFSSSYDAGASTDVTISIDINGTARVLTDVVTVAGTDEERPDRSVLIVVGLDQATGKQGVAFVAMPDDHVAPGTLEVGSGRVEGVMVFTPQGAQDPDEIYFLGGTLDLTAAGTGQGASWEGVLDVRVWETPFF